MGFRFGMALVVALLLALGRGLAQTVTATDEYIAFRLDAERAIAVLKFLSTAEPYRGSVQPDARISRYGFAPFDPPESWRKWIPAFARVGDRWRIHVSQGRSVDAVAERIVAGQPQCEGAIGMQLRVVPEQAWVYAAAAPRYYVATLAKTDRTAASDADGIGFVPEHAIDAASRRALDVLLNDLLRREHPKIRAESDAVFARLSTYSAGPHVARAREWRDMDEELAQGRAILRYDTQTVKLNRDEPPLYFARAEWMVGRKQAFAAAVWVRSGETLRIVQANVQPASWLRMHEFQGHVFQSHLGLLLNVLDRDGDGWGEVLFVQEGYEGFGITLQEYSPSGFERQTAGYGTGC